MAPTDYPRYLSPDISHLHPAPHAVWSGVIASETVPSNPSGEDPPEISQMYPRTVSEVTIPGIYLLLGEMTLEARLHIKMLTFLQSILVNTQSVLHNLALRSISMKDRNSHSWFIYIDKILHKYDFPSLSDLLCLRPASGPWKRYIHARVSNYCLADLQDQARLKSSLRVLCLDRCRIGKPHQVWQIYILT